MGPLTLDEIEFLQELIAAWQDATPDMSQREWANSQVISDKLEEMLND